MRRKRAPDTRATAKLRKMKAISDMSAYPKHLKKYNVVLIVPIQRTRLFARSSA